jgi:hypothetical protein
MNLTLRCHLELMFAEHRNSGHPSIESVRLSLLDISWYLDKRLLCPCLLADSRTLQDKLCNRPVLRRLGNSQRGMVLADAIDWLNTCDLSGMLFFGLLQL